MTMTLEQDHYVSNGPSEPDRTGIKPYRFGCVRNTDRQPAPIVRFVSKWHHGRLPETVAHDSTGRTPETGEWHLGVSLVRRSNRMIRFGGDLWRLGFDFAPDALALLRDCWRLQNHETPAPVRNRMEQTFSKTFFVFDAFEEQVRDWRDFLGTVLSDRSSYVALRGLCGQGRL